MHPRFNLTIKNICQSKFGINYISKYSCKTPKKTFAYQINSSLGILRTKKRTPCGKNSNQI